MQSGWLTSAPTNHLLSTISSILATLVLNGHPVPPAAIRNLLIFPSAIDRILVYMLSQRVAKSIIDLLTCKQLFITHKTK